MIKFKVNYLSMFYNAKDFRILPFIGALVIAGFVGWIVDVLGGKSFAGFVAFGVFIVSIVILQAIEEFYHQRPRD